MPILYTRICRFFTLSLNISSCAASTCRYHLRVRASFFNTFNFQLKLLISSSKRLIFRSIATTKRAHTRLFVFFSCFLFFCCRCDHFRKNYCTIMCARRACVTYLTFFSPFSSDEQIRYIKSKFPRLKL